jgi:hypothetical protein
VNPISDEEWAKITREALERQPRENVVVDKVTLTNSDGSRVIRCVVTDSTPTEDGCA